MMGNFSAFPWERVPKITSRQAQLESLVARWLAVRPHGDRLTKLVGRPGGVRVELVAPSDFDPFAARCEVRVDGAAFDVRGTSRAVRTIAQRLLGGPEELAAPRPLTIVERSIWSLVVATAVEDLGVVAEVWPLLADARSISPDDVATRAAHRGARNASVVELAITVGDLAIGVSLVAPAELATRALPARPWPDWFDTSVLDVPVVLGRCALARADLDRLAPRSVVTLERPAGDAELEVFGGVVGLRAAKGAESAVVAEVATGYVPRDMSLPDDAHVELTVALGTTQLSLRQISELAVGQVVQLRRPLSGPFELRAAGRVLGRGELVDVDGELAVRIVSLGD